MSHKIVKLTQGPDYYVDITGSLVTGRYVVELREGDADAVHMTPTQARTLARALEDYASRAEVAQERLRSER